MPTYKLLTETGEDLGPFRAGAGTPTYPSLHGLAAVPRPPGATRARWAWLPSRSGSPRCWSRTACTRRPNPSHLTHMARLSEQLS